MIRHDDPTPLIAGAVDVSTVMEKLSSVRPVFHSEADFQHAFAWVLREIEPSLQIRLEVRQDTREYVELLCFGPRARTAVEFKYFTRTWVGADPVTGESFHLRNHEATDLGRQGFVFDIARLEKFCASGRASNGFAIMLTNDQRLWQPPATAKLTRDQAFRIHEGQKKTCRVCCAGARKVATTPAASGPCPAATRSPGATTPTSTARTDNSDGLLRRLSQHDPNRLLTSRIAIPPVRIVTGGVFGARWLVDELCDEVTSEDVGDPRQLQPGHPVDGQRVSTVGSAQQSTGDRSDVTPVAAGDGEEQGIADLVTPGKGERDVDASGQRGSRSGIGRELSKPRSLPGLSSCNLHGICEGRIELLFQEGQTLRLHLSYRVLDALTLDDLGDDPRAQGSRIHRLTDVSGRRDLRRETSRLLNPVTHEPGRKDMGQRGARRCCSRPAYRTGHRAALPTP